MNSGKRLTKIGEKIGPGPRQRRLSSDKHVVVTVFAEKGKDFTCGFFEPAPCAVADDRIADFLGDREASARRSLVATGARLEHKATQSRFLGS